MKMTFRAEGGVPRNLPPGSAITCSYTKLYVVSGNSIQELWAAAHRESPLVGGTIHCTGYDNTRADWEAMSGTKADPNHHFRDDD